MPHAGARRGGWHRKGAGRYQPVPDQNKVRKYQATTPQEIFAVVKRQRELFQILCCAELLSDSKDLFALARTRSKTLHRIAIHQLLKTSSRTLYSAPYWACMSADVELLGTTMRLRADVDYGFLLAPTTLAADLSDILALARLWLSGLKMETGVRLLELLLRYNASPDPLRNFPPLNEGEVPIICALMDDGVPPEILKHMVAASSDMAWSERSIHIRGHYAYYEHYIRAHGTGDRWPSLSLSPADLGANLEEGESFTPQELEKLKILREAALSPDGTARCTGWTHITFLEHALHADLRPAKQRQLLELSLAGCSPLREGGRLNWGLQGYLLRDRMTSSLFGDNNWGLQGNPLACLCVSGYVDSFPVRTVVEFLIQHGTPVDTRDWLGLTALHFACKFTDLDLVDQLLGHGADVNAIDIIGLSALHFACRSEPPSVGLGRELSDEDHDASTEKRAQIVSLLLRKGADPTATATDYEEESDGEACTALHYACKHGFLGAVSVLLADERVDANAGLLLHSLSVPHDIFQLICNKDKAEIAELLIAAGADVRARDRLGQLPIMGARKCGLWGVVDVLSGHGGDDGFG
ncbi:hypothetical protein DL770_000183 [Monosporascus sp. CRB-9-2]|nr:hypothetical protein DL770_000183 [Monosporascus sp. CRB-9-2]